MTLAMKLSSITQSTVSNAYIFYLVIVIKARLWNAAHEVTVKKIAPDAIINDNYEFLHSLLSELASATTSNDGKDIGVKGGDSFSNKIIDWDTKGRVFYDFINIDIEVKELLQKRDETSVGYHIEKLRPQVRYVTTVSILLQF